MRRPRQIGLALGCTAALFAPAAWGQIPGVTIFEDSFVNPQGDFSSCDLINAANAELVVLSATGELVLVSGEDVVIPGSFVTDEGDVFLDDELFGFITFEDDADGFRTLWWLSPTGRAVDIDGLTFFVSESVLFPSDFRNVPCSACDAELWDDPEGCGGVVPPPQPPPPSPPDDGDTVIFPTFNFCGAGVGMMMMVSFLCLSGMKRI